MIVRAATLAVTLATVASPAAAQDARTAVSPETVSVGGVFDVAVRVDVPVDAVVRFADTLAVADDLENAEPVRRFDEAAPSGGRRVTAIYRLSAWRPGTLELPDAVATIVRADGSERTVASALPSIHVLSVLPADTAGVEPREAKGVVGGAGVLWPWVAGAVAVALALAVGIVALVRRRRRRRAESDALPHGTPRERALAALDDALARELIERGRIERFHALVADAVRGYVAAVEPRLGRELTTSEVLAGAAPRFGADRSAELGRVLAAADRVKFAGARPDAAAARSVWRMAYDWLDAASENGASAAVDPSGAGEKEVEGAMAVAASDGAAEVDGAAATVATADRSGAAGSAGVAHADAGADGVADAEGASDPADDPNGEDTR